jgi:TonB-linked SusC/RagA family outer membrane protein
MRKHAFLPKVAMLLLVFLLRSFVSTAQDKTISGIVTDQTDGTPLQSVSVKVKGTNIATQTNSSGYYSIKAAPGKTLVFSFVGYNTLEEKVGNESTLNVKISNDDKRLNEVVVTALNIKRDKRSLGYSTAEVKGEEIAAVNRENVFTSLAGRMPGVTVTPTSGAVGASAQIVLRGFNSVGLSNQPLIVVDGVPFNNETFNQGNLVSDKPNRDVDYTNRGADLNPEDIENVTVLKGPEAAALYGALGANGAILFTTKKGKPGKGKVTYDYNTRWDVIDQNRIPNTQNVYDQGNNGVFDITTRSTFGPKFPAGTVTYNNAQNFFQVGRMERHNLSLEGGADKTFYRFSAQYTNQQGTVPNTDFKRLNMRLNSSTRILNKIDVSSSFAYFNSVVNKPIRGQDGLMTSLWQWPIDDDVRQYLNPDGTKKRINPNQLVNDVDNPFFDVNFNKNTDRSNRLTGSLNLSMDATSWLQLTARLGADFSAANGNNFIHPNSSQSVTSGAGFNRGRIENYTNNDLLLNYQFVASVKQQFGKFKTTLRIGTALDDYRRFTSSQRGDSLFIPDFNSLDNTNPTFQRLRQRDMKRRIMGVFGEFSVNYDNLVYLTVAGRNDWASPLPEQNRSFFYPTASLSFVVSDLKGVKDATASWLDIFRLRTSLAATNRFPTPYQNQAAFLAQTTSGGGFAYDFFAPNPDLKPERQSTYELGFEAKFLKNRLGIDFAYYNTTIKDQIGQLLRLSYGSGFVLNTQNFTDTRNWGTEIQLTGVPIKTKDFVWNIALNFNRMRNQVLRMPANLPEFYVSDNFVSDSRGSMFNGGTTTSIGGREYLRNVNGDVIIDPTTGFPLINTIYTPIGERNPNYTLGINNQISYKNWSFSMLWDYRNGGDIFNLNEWYRTNRGYSERTLDRERPRIIPGVLNDANVNSANPTKNTISITPMFRSNYWSSIRENEYVERDIRWLRLRDVTITYNVPKSALAKTKFISAMSVYFTGTDLFLITNYSGIDPLTNANTPATPGVGGFGFDYGTVPLPRTFLVGVRASF